MIEHSHWHPVIQSGDVAQSPVAVQLLDVSLVIWRDAAGCAHAWADQCPHRGAKLSLGRVCQGQLECPYHGWQFNSAGHCTQVPAVPDFVPPDFYVARAYEACEKYGLVWVRLAKEAGQALPVFAAESEGQLRKLNCGPYDVATSAPRLIENFLDMAHFGFVHDGWLGSRDATAIGDYQVQPTPTGLLATQCRALQPKSNVHSTAAAQVEYTYEVLAPYAAVLTKVPDPRSLPAAVGAGHFRESIAMFVCPVSAEASRVWFRLAVADFESIEDTLRAFQDTIFRQDQTVLESQTPKRLPLQLTAELHTSADKASMQYRRHLKALGCTFGVC